MRSGSRKIVLIVGLLAVTLLLLAASQPSILPDGNGEVLALSQNPSAAEAAIANCRYGASPLDRGSALLIPGLGAGWYLNFQGRPPSGVEPDNGAEFVHMIDVHQRKSANGSYLPSYDIDPPLDAAYAKYIRENRGRKYIAGNETDRIGQGETHPEIYAAAYHEIYNFVKSNDPSAEVAITALVQFTPNRQQYLDKVWRSYIAQFGSYMPVDIWTMHIYVLPELGKNGDNWVPNGIASIALGTDAGLGKREALGDASKCSESGVYCFAEHDDLKVFSEQVRAMRQWMKNHGQQRKPLLLTEFSILYPYEDDGPTCFLQDEYGNCFTPDRVTQFMTAAFNYLKSEKDPELGYPLDNNRLVQQWMWFSVYFENEGSASNLVQKDLTTLTKMGQNFKTYVASETLYQNLLVDDVADVAVATNGAATATAKISVTFRNNGSKAINTPFTVSFYKNSGLTDKIGSVIINPTVYGCSSQAYTAEVSWPGLEKGTHPYYVLVDSGRVVTENPANDVDNTGQGSVTVYANQTNLPVIRGAQ